MADLSDTQRLLATIANRLHGEYGSPTHGNPSDPLDDLIFIMLTRRTPISKARAVYECLRTQEKGSWEAVHEKGRPYLSSQVRELGMGNQRVDDILEVLERIRNEFGAMDLSPLAQWSDDEVQEFLQSLPGVGQKSALCVMMYSMNRHVFPADAHCIRVLKRIGIVPPDIAKNHRRAQRFLADIVPGEVAYRLHVNLVAHGQQVCTACNPECDNCVLRKMCAYQSSDGV